MDARPIFLAALIVVVSLTNINAQQVVPMQRHLGGRQARAESENFVILAANQQVADQIARTAESYRRELSQHWLGYDLPNWNVKCPITVMAADNLGAGGETTFTLSHRTIVQWRMRVQGSHQRVLDSVLPHEITHTILATHFAQFDTHVPRWADEGASTTVEHADERSKNDRMLTEFLTTGRGIPFATLFSLKEYPPDILPLYAQGYSLSIFLIGQGGPQKFVKFLETGVQSSDWVNALRTHYGYQQLGNLQIAWNQWVADGGGAVAEYTAVAMNNSVNNGVNNAVALNPQSDDAIRLASATTANANGDLAANMQNENTSAAYQRISPNGKFAVGRSTNSSIEISDGFEPIARPQSKSAFNSDPISLALKTQEQNVAPNSESQPNWAGTSLNHAVQPVTPPVARIADNQQPNLNPPNYQFQAVGPTSSRTSAVPGVFQGVGSSPASIQFGPAEPLYR